MTQTCWYLQNINFLWGLFSSNCLGILLITTRTGILNLHKLQKYSMQSLEKIWRKKMSTFIINIIFRTFNTSLFLPNPVIAHQCTGLYTNSELTNQKYNSVQPIGWTLLYFWLVNCVCVTAMIDNDPRKLFVTLQMCHMPQWIGHYTNVIVTCCQMIYRNWSDKYPRPPVLG